MKPSPALCFFQFNFGTFLVVPNSHGPVLNAITQFVEMDQMRGKNIVMVSSSEEEEEEEVEEEDDDEEEQVEEEDDDDDDDDDDKEEESDCEDSDFDEASKSESESGDNDVDDSSLSDKVVSLLRGINLLMVTKLLTSCSISAVKFYVLCLIFPEGKDIQSLKLRQCKAYLRNHGLRIAGNRDVCVARIREHWR